MTIIDDDLVKAYTAFNDAAVALRSATLLDAPAAADRLEHARKSFQDKFMRALQIQASQSFAANKAAAV